MENTKKEIENKNAEISGERNRRMTSENNLETLTIEKPSFVTEHEELPPEIEADEPQEEVTHQELDEETPEEEYSTEEETQVDDGEENEETNAEIEKRPSSSLPENQTFLYHGFNYIDAVTDSDPEFKTLTNLVTLSVPCERFRILENTKQSFNTQTPITGKQLNIWAMPYGEARITHKSTTLEIPESAMEAIELMNWDTPILLGQEFTFQALIGIGKLLSAKPNKKNKEDTCPEPDEETLTIIEQQEKRRFKVLWWLHDDANNTVRDLKDTRGYLRGLDNVLNRLYDGKSYTRITQAHGLERLESPYLTILLSGTPEMPKSLRIESFSEGFCVRFIFWHIRPASMREKSISIGPDAEKSKQFYLNYLNALFQVGSYTWIVFNITAKQMIQDFVDKKYAEAKTQLDKEETVINRLRYGYYGNLQNLTERLSALLLINRTLSLETLESMKTKPLGRPIIVHPYDVECAISFIERVVLVGLEETVKLVATQNTVDLKIESDKVLFDNVVDILRKSEVQSSTELIKNAITMSDLHRKIGLRYYRFKETMSAMENMGLIEVQYAVHMKRGAPAIVVKLKKENPTPIDPTPSDCTGPLEGLSA